MLSKTAHYLANHHFQKHLFFLALAIISVWVNGYHFGTFDQVAHISFLKKSVNPELYPNDPFLALREYHFSYFWLTFMPLYEAGILEESMFVIHILTVYGTFWMFWALSDILFGNSLANLLVTLALIFPHIGFPGFQIIEFSLLNRTFALPFILGSIWLYLKDRRFLAYLLLGVMFNIHAVYVVFVLCMFLLNDLFTLNRKTYLKTILKIFIFFLAGMPVLIWRLQTGHGIDLSLRPDLLSVATRSLLYTVYYPIGPISFVIGNFLAGIGTLWGFLLGYRETNLDNKHIAIKNFVIAIGILLLIGVITSYLLPITILIQFQILRAGVFLLYFGMIYLSFFLVSKHKKGFISQSQFNVLSLCFILLITPLFSISLWLFFKLLDKPKTRVYWLIPAVISLHVIIISIGIMSGLWSPGFHIFGPNTEWRDIQEWAKANTELDAKFLSPPHFFGHYTPDWRVFSERTPYATISEFLTLHLDPDYADDLVHRFEAVAPGAITLFDGNYMHSIDVTEKQFYKNSGEYLSEIACMNSLDYLVVESTHPYDFIEVYQNNGFILYKFPDCSTK